MIMACRAATIQSRDRKGAGKNILPCPLTYGRGSECTSEPQVVAPKKRAVLSEKGFTLLEMIVALTLVAMMAVGLWAVFSFSVRAWSRGTEFIDTNLRHRNILDMVRKQIASTYGLLAPADLKTGAAPYLIFNGTENNIRFISLNSLQFQENPGLTLVSYDVNQDSKGDYSLVEREERYLGQIFDQENSVNPYKTTSIFGNLISCDFEYFDPGDNDNPSQWVKEWDAQKEGRLPVAISITMMSRDFRGNNQDQRLVVPIQATVANIGINPTNPFGVGRAGRR